MNSGLLQTYLMRIKKWNKLFLPRHKLRYYPPRFVLGDPVVKGVCDALSKGKQVAVVVVSASNLLKFSKQLEANQLIKFITGLKRGLKYTIENSKYKDDILVVHDHYSDGLTIFFKTNDDTQSVTHIEQMLRVLMPKLEK